MSRLDDWRKTILARMREALSPLGFRKHGAVFNRWDGAVWLVAALQSSAWNVEGRLTVYLNVGLHYGETSELVANPKTGPKEPECHWRGRPPHQSWEITSDEEAESAATEIAGWTVKLLEEARAAFPTPKSLLGGLQPGTNGTREPEGAIYGTMALESLKRIANQDSI